MHLHPGSRLLWRIRAGVGAVVLTAAVGAAAGALHAFGGVRWGYLAVVVVLVVAVPWVVVVPGRRYRAWRYEMTDDALELHYGLWTRVHSDIPYQRVQNVDITSGPVERALGLCTLAMRTASAVTDATIPGVDAEAATELRRTILARAGRDDAA